jgi:hypothetical protein
LQGVSSDAVRVRRRRRERFRPFKPERLSPSFGKLLILVGTAEFCIDLQRSSSAPANARASIEQVKKQENTE